MVTEYKSRREEIYQELYRRLSNAFPQSGIERGFFDETVSTYDMFYIFELPESCTLGKPRRGQYQCTYGISVSYWHQTDTEHMFETGNQLLEDIRMAIEIDEYFWQDGDQSKPLVLGYQMDEGALIWYDEGVIDVELLYLVDYTKEAGWMSKPFIK